MRERLTQKAQKENGVVNVGQNFGDFCNGCKQIIVECNTGYWQDAAKTVHITCKRLAQCKYIYDNLKEKA